MVTKESTAHLLPEHWRKEAVELANIIPIMSHTAILVAILDLLDHCVKEAVLLNIAEMEQNNRKFQREISDRTQTCPYCGGAGCGAC